MSLPPPAILGRDATIGILGGGQLGRMLVLAAARLGLKCHVYCPDPQSPAFDVTRRVTVADYHDEAALAEFARDTDVITYEFENVPAHTVRFLESRAPVLPNPAILETVQDRALEKRFVAGLGVETARFIEVASREDLEAAATLGWPTVLKTRRFGYDGKGQALLRSAADFDTAWRDIGEQAAIVEAFVSFEKEISVVAARALDGTIACFDVTENEHKDHVLKRSVTPAEVSPAVTRRALEIAAAIAEALDFVGVLAVEMFVVPDRGSHRVLVNEIAPRVHNSGHWTLDGASVSQFEQHIRAIAGWPLQRPVRRGRVEMINLLGDDIEQYEQWLKEPGASLHLYGKASVRAGRKMGHVTRLLP